MNRDWIRAFRRKGIMVWMMPVLVMSLMAVAYVQYVDDYFEHWDEADSLSAKLEATNEVVRISKDMDKRKIVLKPDYDLWQTRAFITEKPEAAQELMKNSLMQTLQTLYFEQIKIEPVKAEESDKSPVVGTGLLVLEAQFVGVPQQLPRLESALQTQAKTIRIGDIQIKAIVPTPPVVKKPIKEIKAIKVLKVTNNKIIGDKVAKDKAADGKLDKSDKSENTPYLEMTVRFVAPYMASTAIVANTTATPAASAASKPLPNSK